MNIRLDKFLSSRGYCSRRGAGEFLKGKRVEVNRTRILEPGTRINPEKDQILINGKGLETVEKKYFIVNKPIGHVSTVSDPHNRKTVLDLLPKEITRKYRLYPVGRLDQDSEGLVLLTNDGDITYKITHPKSHIPKTYEVTINGKVKAGYLQMIRRGIELKHYKTSPAKVKKISVENGKTILELTLYEGKNRQIRRMCKALNLDLVNLKRVSIGSVELGNLEKGKSRELDSKKIMSLIDEE